MFPMKWSNEKIMHAISEVLVNNTWIQKSGKLGSLYAKAGDPARFLIEGYYEGVKIRVIATNMDIITAFPIK
jgi:hypothetical protein